MRRFIGYTLSLIIMFTIITPAIAAETESEYYSIPIEYSDGIGSVEALEVLIHNGHVFVNAQMLAELLGYTFTDTSEGATIVNTDKTNGLPVILVHFKYNSNQVSYSLLNRVVTYEAPFESIKNDKASWIPLEYSLLLLQSGMMVVDDVLLIDTPTKRIINYFYDIAINLDKYSFDWADDFGYSDTELKVLAGSSHLINVFGGLLARDGTSWLTLFQQFAGRTDAYDQKYGENLALLLCTESDKELQATVERVDMVVDLLSEDGKLGELLSQTSDLLDSQVNTLYEHCENVLLDVKAGNSPLVLYNKAYQALDATLDKQIWFSDTGGTILQVQKELSEVAGDAFCVLNVGKKVLEVASYAQEFQKQDGFASPALKFYLDTAKAGVGLPETMHSSMSDYANLLLSSMAEYTLTQFAQNIDNWIIESVPIDSALGMQASGILFAWDIMSKTVPFISNGLSGADSFELALYSQIFQCDAFLNYQNLRDSVFENTDEMTPEDLYEVSQYFYVFLKSCYTTREAAVASLVNTTDSVKEQRQTLIDYQNSINTEIAEFLVGLKNAKKVINDDYDYAYGFMPFDNENYLEKYDDSRTIDWVRSISLVTDAYKYEISGRRFYIPKINLNGKAIEKINNDLWSSLYDGVVMATQESWDLYEGSEYVIYDWWVHDDVLSLVVESRPVHWAWWDYWVYNISISNEEIVTTDELISIAGWSQDEYHDAVRRALGVSFFKDKESYIGQVGYDAFFRLQLDKTISEENVQNCIPYFNEDGQLCIIGAVYSLAGADYYLQKINLENTDHANDFNEYMETMENASSSDSYIEHYKASLLQHPESTGRLLTKYTLHDINKDGIPELIVRQISEYYVYSFDGSEVIPSDVFYCTYSSGLYAYDGNGIVVHDGGMGSLHIEYASLYTMEENRLGLEQFLMSTEECSFDELYSFLNNLTQIDDFYPITDLSYLLNWRNP